MVTTPPKFNSLPLKKGCWKNDAWKTTFLLGWYISTACVGLPGSITATVIFVYSTMGINRKAPKVVLKGFRIKSKHADRSPFFGNHGSTSTCGTSRNATLLTSQGDLLNFGHQQYHVDSFICFVFCSAGAKKDLFWSFGQVGKQNGKHHFWIYGSLGALDISQCCAEK